MKKTLKRILCSALSVLTVSTLALERSLSNAGAEYAGTTTTATASFKNITGQYDTSKLRESYLNSSALQAEETAPKYETRTVIVTLSGDNMVEAADGESVDAYLETFAGNRAKAKISDEQNAFLRALSKRNIPYTLEGKYNNVLNGVAIEVNTEYVSEIKKMSGVKSVVITTAYSEPKTVTTSTDGDNVVTNETNVYKTGIYDSSEYAAQYGAGTVVAVLDTGLDYTHPAFQGFQSEDVEIAWDKAYVQGLLENNDLISEKRSGSLEVSDVYVSAKVPFAYDYADDDPDVYPSYSNHGTHVAGIIGGYDTNGYTDKEGNPVDETFVGVVPDSQLVICKVFTDDLDDPDLGGAVSEDIIAALDDCVSLGVDVINMSLGTSCGFTTTDDGDSEGEMLNAVYEAIKDAGISLICAASNDYSAGYGGVYGTNLAANPDSGTVGSPSTFAAALSVASVNGQKASYMVANEADSTNKAFVFYEEARDIDGNPFDFVVDMQRLYGKTEFEYVVVPGIGQAADYDSKIRALFKGANRVALVKRGDTSFQEKVEIAMQMGAAGVMIYNNVAGIIRMNLGEIDNPVPAVSINMNAGNALIAGAKNRVGTIRLGEDLKAGPFMSEFSSWGPTHDLKLKPEITAHGGEITSTVPGGYGEQSGTSMASPNMAGFTALVRSYIKNDLGVTNPVEINRLATQLVMSTATTAYDQDGLAYSPRKQGAGLARMERVIGGTSAYLWTDVEENDYRPKLELGDDEEKTGVYTMSFNLTNFGDSALTFNTDQIVMTETLSSDKLTVSEQAYMLNKAKTVWTLNGGEVSEVTVGSKEEVTLQVTITLDESEKKYIDKSFENGMYVEGFLQLKSQTAGQCDLSIPFLAFYGDWEAAPMLDYTAFEVAENEQDGSVKEEDKIKASVFATQPYTSYYNEKYILPMGGYVYLLPDDAEPMYVSEDKCSVSRYNVYYGEGEAENYMTSTSIKAVYAGLLRNARIVKYRLYNEATGELMLEDVCHRIGKAYAGGGQATPANVELELSPEAMNLMANGKYRMEFDFFLDQDALVDENGDYILDGDGNKTYPDHAIEANTYKFSFTVDYEAPILEDVRIRYYDYKDGNKQKQRIYLDVDVYDNHYAQALMLCYPQKNANGDLSLMLATDYPTPIRDAKPNGTTTVSIEITDIYEKYGSQFYIQVDDYAINSCLYQVDINAANLGALETVKNFEIVTDKKLTETDGVYSITLNQYEAYKVDLNFAGNGNESNFVWSVNNGNVAVKNGEIVGLAEGTAEVAVSTGKGEPKCIQVTVTGEKHSALVSVPAISFGVIMTNQEALAKASGTVKVNVGQEIVLPVETDPWYHPMTDLRIVWSTTDPSVATVDQNGNVKTLKKGTTVILAAVERKKANGEWEKTLYSTSVTLRVQNEFTVSNYTLTAYNGLGGEVIIPTDMNIWYIGAEAFKDNNNITKIVIPASVTQISERAFMNCTALEEVYFVNEKHRVDANGNIVQYDESWNELPAGQMGQVIDWADVSMIYEHAFYGCPKLRKVDFSNVKTVTVAHYAFADCVNLTEVVDMPSIGTMHHYAFANTALQSVDLTGLHMSGEYVFANCTQLVSMEVGKFTAIGKYMFAGCTELRNPVTICTTKVGDGAFMGCVNLSGVKFQSPVGEKLDFEIGARAFESCGSALNGANFTVDFGGENIRVMGDRAFAGSSMKELTAFKGLEVLGSNVFANTFIKRILITDDINVEQMRFLGIPFEGLQMVVVPGCTKYVQNGNIIYNADKTKIIYVNPAQSGLLVVPDTVTEIGAYAFADSNVTIVFATSVTKLGVGAFENSALTRIEFGDAQLTEIPENAFRGTELVFIDLPNSVKVVGDYAFADSALSEFNANGLERLGNNVFENCIALRGVEVEGKYVLTLAESLTEMGNRVFAGCTDLVYVSLPSITKLGAYTFHDAKALKEVVFGEDTTTIGNYTFLNTRVEKVELGKRLETIAEGAFYGCNRLAEITLPDTVKTIERMAFEGCSSLKTVNGIENVIGIDVQAFYESGIENVTLSSVKSIGDFAFASQKGAMKYTAIEMPMVETIGNFAFFGGGETEVVIPTSLIRLGFGAFANSTNLTTFTVDNNPNYFVEDGMLYRVLNNGTGNEYEVLCYPAAYEAADKVATLKTNTLRVEAYAFYGLNVGMVEEVILPYTINAIGDAAFYASGIKEYTFESIQAPVLETVYRQEVTDGIEEIISELNGAAYYKGYFNANFETEVYNFTKYVGMTSKLVMNYPTNGNGYNNHIYKLFFGVRNAAGVLAEDDTRTCIDLIQSLPEAKEIKGWVALEKTEENKAMVQSWSDIVRRARSYYNNATAKEGQTQFVTEELSDKLLAVEKELRTVKKAFGIAINLSELRVASTSTHKTTYMEGDTFDMTGLVIELVYDDYSTEIAKASQVQLKTTTPLSRLTRYVVITYGGEELRVLVTVQAIEPEEPEDEVEDEENVDSSEEKKGCKSVVGGVALTMLFAAGALVFKRKKGN